jgi:cytochrome c biogenesis protein CcmG, thiol:disulfide interchange protein DsbE
MNQRQLAIGTVGLLVIIAIAAVAWYVVVHPRQLQNASEAPIMGKAAVGATAPQFEVSTTAGLFDLDKADKPVFLEVFATWCPHCQHEVPVVNRLYHAYRARVDFVGVSGSQTAMDGVSESSQADVLDWVQRFHVEYPVAYDPLLNVATLYLQGGFPTYAIVGRNKKVDYLNSGEASYNELNSALKKALR